MRARLTRRLKLLILAGIALLIGWALGVLPPRQDVQAAYPCLLLLYAIRKLSLDFAPAKRRILHVYYRLRLGARYYVLTRQFQA